MPGFHPSEVAAALRQEHPGTFDDLTDHDLIEAIKIEDPGTYKLIDPLLLGAEVLTDPRLAPPPPKPPTLRNGQPADLSKPLPLPTPAMPKYWLDTGVETALRLGGGIGGGMAGGATGVPMIAVAGMGAGAGMGEVAAQKYAQRMGYDPRTGISWPAVAVQSGLAMVPMGSTAGLGPLGATAVRAGQGAILGPSGALAESVITGQPTPSLKDLAASAGAGALVGGGLHGATEIAQAAPSFDVSTFGAMPTEEPPASPGATASHLIMAAQVQQAADVTEFNQGMRRATHDEANRAIPELNRAVQAKDYLQRMADRQLTPIPLPETLGVAPPPFRPVGPDRQLPASTPIPVYPPGFEPTLDPNGSGEVPRAVQMPSAGDRIEGALDAALQQPPGPPRLNRQPTDLYLKGEVPGRPGATQPALGAVPTRPVSMEGPIEQGARIGGAPAREGQPALPHVTESAPADRTYATGPNAGPRQKGEAHGIPRTYRRRVYQGGSYTMEEAPTRLTAEDPGTYPPEVRRELASMLWEMEQHPHTRIEGGVSRDQLNYLTQERGLSADAAIAELRKSGATAGGAIAGAPVYHEIKAAAQGYQNATREAITQHLRSAVLEGRGSEISDAAAQIARRRLALRAAGENPLRSRMNSRGERVQFKTLLAERGDEGDALIGWTDPSGAKALPEQDLDEVGRSVREASDGEIWAARKILQQSETEIPDALLPFYHQALDEGVRRGLWQPEQPGLTMEGPGGDKGPSLLDYASEAPPVRPRTIETDIAEQIVANNARKRGTPEDVPQNPIAQQLEAERKALEAAALPGLEGVRQESRPTPPVAEAPFALTPPTLAETKATLASRRQGSLFDRLKGEEGVLILDVPAGDRAGLKKWLGKQEDEHGTEAWFSRVEQAIADGDWDRAWKAAASASMRSYVKAYAATTDPREEARLAQAVKGTPLQGQEDLNTQLVEQGRRQSLRGAPTAPAVADFPPSRPVSQAGAARGKATLGPAGIINPGPPKRPLEAKFTDHLLGKNLLSDILKATDPDLVTLVPGNSDTNLRLFRQVGDLAFAGVNTKEVKQFLGLSNEEIAQHYLRSVSEAARILQQLSAFRQVNADVLDRLANQMSMGGALRGMLGDNPPPAIVGARGRVIGRVGSIEPERTLEALAESTRSFDQAMLVNTLQRPKKASEWELLQSASYPFMVSKWATAVRNAISQMGRYSMEALDEAFTVPLATVLGDQEGAALAGQLAKERAAGVIRPGAKVTPRTSWKETTQEIYDFTADTLEKLSPNDARQTIKILTEFPTEQANFLGWAEQLSEGPSRFKVLNSLLDPKVQRLITVFNRASEFTGRGLVFDATMRGQLRAKGLDPSAVLMRPVADIAEAVGGSQALDELLHNAVSASLEATFASRLAKDSIPGALVRAVNHMWPLKMGYPFPRFNLVAAPRVFWDHGPWALLDLVRFPLDAIGVTSSDYGGSRLYRGMRGQALSQKAIPELVGKRQAAEGRLGGAVRDLVASKRELAIRNRQIARIQQAGTELPGADSLEAVTTLRDQLQRRVGKAQATIGTEKSTIRDLRSQEEKLLDVVRDAHGIGAPTLPQYFARVATGTFGPLAAALVIRSQPQVQGAKWYEYPITDPRTYADGKDRDPLVLDFRPFAPFAQYLFVADVLQDFYHHTDWPAAQQQVQQEGGHVAGPLDWNRAVWEHYTGKYTNKELGAQFAQAFLSMSRAAGTTLTITDLLTKNGWPSLQDAADAITGTIGQFLSRFTIPLQQVKDVAAHFDPEEAKARIPPRATLEEPYRPLAAPLANVPGVSRLIPEQISQTTGKPLATEFPLLRSLAGIGSSPRDFISEEVRRVGVPGQAVFIRETGDVGLDRLVAESYSKVLQQELPEIFSDPEYRSLGTPADQRDFLQTHVFPLLKKAALGDVREALGEDRFAAAMVTGETARKKARQSALLDRLEGELPPSREEPDPDLPPGPPPAADVASPPPRPF